MGNFAYKDTVYEEMVVQSLLKDRRIILNEEVNEQSMQKLRLSLLKIKRMDDINGIKIGDRKPI